MKPLMRVQALVMRVHAALRHKVRRNILHMLFDAKSVPFKDIHKRLRIKPGLAAYHVGVLEAAGLVSHTYDTRGSQYSIEPLAKEKFVKALLRELEKIDE